MPARTLGAPGAGTFAKVAMVLSLAGSASAADGGHGLGRMGPTAARTTPVSPATGPDLELPFVCGQRWIGGSRSGHSPSSYTIDFNTSNDLGRPALASAPGVVTRAATLTGSYGRHVVVDHGGYTTLYAHLNQIVATVGTYLDQGDLVGYVGGSGNVTGPHLHFEQRKGGAYFPPYFHRTTFPMGSTGTAACNDRPVTGDWDGNGRTDIGLFRAATGSGQFYQRRGTASTHTRWGRAGVVPVTGDFNGDGRTDVATRSLGTPRFLQRSANGAFRASTNYGVASDVPLNGDWDGNGTSDLGVYSRSTGYWTLRVARGSSYALKRIGYGQSTDVPITGDWNGDGSPTSGSGAPRPRSTSCAGPGAGAS